MAAVTKKPITFFSQFTTYLKDSNGANWSHPLPWSIANNLQSDGTNISKAVPMFIGATMWHH
jgi:hypothetical protein